jgi:hypothetical protein
MTMRFLGLLKADRSSEAGEPPSPELMERCCQFMQEVMKAGVLVASEGLQPSATGKRVRVENNQVTIIDGPFAELKEVVASYAILETKDMAEAVQWTRRFLEVLGGGECEIRPIMQLGDFGSGCASPNPG